MIDGLVLGLLQGLAEWLPISSEGVLTVAQVYLTADSVSLSGSIQLALFLHMGTFLSALIYFRKRVWDLVGPPLRLRSHPSETDRSVFQFLIIATGISGILGFLLLKLISGLESQLQFTGRVLLILVGVLLLITAFVQRYSESEGTRGFQEITWKDAVLLGLAQAFAVFPGLSRSGLTVSALLLLHVGEEESLELSFLMSLPIVLAGNLILNYEYFVLTERTLVGVVVSCLVGLLTIHYLLKLAREVDFSRFVLFFAFLTFLAAYFV